MKPKRGRTSTTALHASPSVLLDQRAIDFDDYATLLGKRYADIRGQVYSRDNPPDAAQYVNALMCGRLVGQSGADARIYERATYCRNRSLCRCCRSIALTARAQTLVGDIAKNRGMKLLHFIFTLPEPQSEDEEVEFLRLAVHQALPTLVTNLQAWNRKSKNESRGAQKHQVGSYVVGVHAPKKNHALYFHPHLHAVVFVHRRCPKEVFGGIFPYLRTGFEHAVNLSSRLYSDVRNLGVLQWSQIDEQTRVAKHRAKTVSFNHAINSFRYVMRVTENNDTAAIDNRRKALLREIDANTTYTTSRSRTSKQVDPPHEFDPDRLGKKAFIFPFGDDRPLEIPRGGCARASADIRRQAEQDVASWFSA